eukprot:gene2409-biopygen4023
MSSSLPLGSAVSSSLPLGSAMSHFHWGMLCIPHPHWGLQCLPHFHWGLVYLPHSHWGLLCEQLTAALPSDNDLSGLADSLSLLTRLLPDGMQLLPFGSAVLCAQQLRCILYRLARVLCDSAVTDSTGTSDIDVALRGATQRAWMLLEVPPHQYGKVIGREGSAIHNIRISSGCDVHVPPSNMEDRPPILLSGTRRTVHTGQPAWHDPASSSRRTIISVSLRSRRQFPSGRALQNQGYVE